MQTLSSYSSRQADLLRMIADVQPLLSLERLKIPHDLKRAHGLLCDLTGMVKRHLAEEDKGIYPSLLIHEDPRVKSIAWGFISGEKPLRRILNDYSAKWLTQGKLSLNDDFLRDSREVLDMLQYRIERERQVLFPKLVEIGLLDKTGAGA